MILPENKFFCIDQQRKAINQITALHNRHLRRGSITQTRDDPMILKAHSPPEWRIPCCADRSPWTIRHGSLACGISAAPEWSTCPARTITRTLHSSEAWRWSGWSASCIRDRSSRDCTDISPQWSCRRKYRAPSSGTSIPDCCISPRSVCNQRRCSATDPDARGRTVCYCGRGSWCSRRSLCLPAYASTCSASGRIVRRTGRRSATARSRSGTRWTAALCP